MRVLLIDKNPRELQAALEQKGIHVDATKTGKEADRMVGSIDYDAIILDVDVALGKKEGLAALKHWRGTGVHTHLFVLTSQNTLQDKLDALSLGADDVIVKPFETKDVVSRVAAVTRRGERDAVSAWTIGDLVIDVSQRRVQRAGRAINLTPREYELLVFLATNRDKPVSRAMIRDHLYTDGRPVTSNVVDVYVRYLRRKIDQGFASALIHTCWGKGYMLRSERDAGDRSGFIHEGPRRNTK